MSLSTTLQVMPRINQGTIIICIIRNLMSSSRILHIFFLSVLPSVETDSTTDIWASILLLRVLQISRDSSRAASAPPGNLSNKKRNRTTTPPPSLLLRIVYLHDKTVAGFLVTTVSFLLWSRRFATDNPLLRGLLASQFAVDPWLWNSVQYWKIIERLTDSPHGILQVWNKFISYQIYSMISVLWISAWPVFCSQVWAHWLPQHAIKFAQQEMLQKFINLVLQNFWSQNDKKQRISVWPNLHFAQAHQIGMMMSVLNGVAI